MSLEIRPDPDYPYGGHALLLLDYADVPGSEATISVFDNYSERYLAPGGWQSAPVTFGPFPVIRDIGGARIAIGPEIVNRIEENAPLRIGIGSRDFEVDWPIDVHPEAAESKPGNLTGKDAAKAEEDASKGAEAPKPVVDPVETRKETRRKPVALIAGGLALLVAAAVAG